MYLGLLGWLFVACSVRDYCEYPPCAGTSIQPKIPGVHVLLETGIGITTGASHPPSLTRRASTVNRICNRIDNRIFAPRAHRETPSHSVTVTESRIILV